MPSTLAELDKRHVWHPFTDMAAWAATEPLIIESASGRHLYDVDGNRYLDAISSLWVNVLGHNHPRLNAAITEQLGKVAHSTLLGLANVPSVQLAEQLAARAPAGLNRVFYSDNGSTAVEVALKMAFQFWQLRGETRRTRFVALDQAYHGDTLGAVSVGGISLFHHIFHPLVFHVLRTPAPHPYRHPAGPDPDRCREACLETLNDLLTAHHGEIAALVIEPLVQGAAGILVHPPGYLRGVAELCRRHDILLIADEVAVGFGRTGRLFACEHEGVEPDFLALAKGISGGYLPLAATLVQDRILDAYDAAPAERRTFFHGHSYTGNPLACAVAIATLREIDDANLLAHLPATIAHIEKALAARIAPLAPVGDIRQRGLMVGVELVADRASRQPFPAENRTGAAVCLHARRHGVILRPLGDTVVIMPPLTMTHDELDQVIDALAASIDAVMGGLS